MTPTTELERELDRIREEIDRMREYAYEIETDFRMVQDRCGWLQALSVYWLRRDLARRIELLKLRNNAVRACYLQKKRDEEARRSGGPRETPA